MKNPLFKNFCLNDDEVQDVIEQIKDEIVFYSIINGKVDKNLMAEIISTIYLKITRNRKNKKN